MTRYEQMVEAYQKMYLHTKDECANCSLPHTCCSVEYCDLAEQRAKTFGIHLHKTGHPRLPYMGPQGCVVKPYLRPLCTLHTCDMNGLGFKKKDKEMKWTDEYFRLRDLIVETEASSGGMP